MNNPTSMVYVIDDDASVRDALSNLLESVGAYAELFGSTRNSSRPSGQPFLAVWF